MIKITIRNQAAEPPVRFRRKHEKWMEANFHGIVTDGQVVSPPNYPNTLDGIAATDGPFTVPYQRVVNSKVCTFFGYLHFAEKPEIGKTCQSTYHGTSINVTFTQEVA